MLITIIIKQTGEGLTYKFMETNLMTYQLGSTEEKAAAVMRQNAILKNLSYIDFSNCINRLKSSGYIGKKQKINYYISETNPALSKYYSNENKMKSAKVKYKLFFQNGNEVNTSLCKKTFTEVNLYLKNYKFINITLFKETFLHGADVFNPKTEFYTSHCYPMKKNSSLLTYRERRQLFSNLTVSCGGDCFYNGFNFKQGYIKCVCDASASMKEVTPRFKNYTFKEFNQTYFQIIDCYQNVFKMVSFLLNIKPNFFLTTGFILCSVVNFLQVAIIIAYVFIDRNVVNKSETLNTVIKYEINYYTKGDDPEAYFGKPSFDEKKIEEDERREEEELKKKMEEEEKNKEENAFVVEANAHTKNIDSGKNFQTIRYLPYNPNIKYNEIVSPVIVGAGNGNQKKESSFTGSPASHYSSDINLKINSPSLFQKKDNTSRSSSTSNLNDINSRQKVSSSATISKFHETEKAPSNSNKTQSEMHISRFNPFSPISRTKILEGDQINIKTAKKNSNFLNYLNKKKASSLFFDNTGKKRAKNEKNESVLSQSSNSSDKTVNAQIEESKGIINFIFRG